MIEIVYIFLFALPATNGIANIMLANNICDIEDDIENKRYTLPIYVGKENALEIYKWIYYISYIDLIIMLVLKVVPLTSILTLFTFVLVNKNIKLFYKKQTKKDTFILAVKNFVVINGTRTLTIALGIIIKKFIV